jgi:HlyD family secretion protein
VWVLRGGQPEPVRVRTGISDGSLTEVVEGELQPADAVVTDMIGGAPAAAGPGPGGPGGRSGRIF